MPIPVRRDAKALYSKSFRKRKTIPTDSILSDNIQSFIPHLRSPRGARGKEEVPHDTPCDLIKAKLTIPFFAVTSVSPLETARKQSVSSFLIKLRRVGHFSEIYDLKLFKYFRVHVRTFDPRLGFLQCFNCNRFRHSLIYCHQPQRCLRCSGCHRGCPKQPEKMSCRAADVAAPTRQLHRLPKIHHGQNEAAGFSSLCLTAPFHLPARGHFPSR